MRLFILTLTLMTLPLNASVGSFFRNIGDVANKSAANSAKGGNDDLASSVGAALAEKSGETGGVLGTLEGLGARGLDVRTTSQRGAWGRAECCPCRNEETYN